MSGAATKRPTGARRCARRLTALRTTTLIAEVSVNRTRRQIAEDVSTLRDPNVASVAYTARLSAAVEQGDTYDDVCVRFDFRGGDVQANETWEPDQCWKMFCASRGEADAFFASVRDIESRYRAALAR